MKEFTGRVAAITGAASGIGLAMAKRFAAEGMKVVLADIDPNLAAIEQQFRDQGADVLAVHTDVANATQVEELASRTIEKFGSVHVLCNNAGTGGPASFWDLTLEDWKFQLGVDLWGVIHGVRAFLPHLREQDEGHIVNTSSIAAFLHGPFIAPYNASKAAVLALTETLYNELALAGSNVHVSVLCPGAVATSMNDEPNVPEHLKLSSRPASPIIEGARSALRAAFAQDALSPASVAEMVIDAIRAEHLYILTHPGYAEPMKQRFESIVSGADQTVFGFDKMTAGSGESATQS